MRHKRRAGVLAASALLLSPVVAQASLPTTTALPTTVAAVALPTSWPAVPVAGRLAPALADQLAAGGAERLRVMVSGESTAAAVAAARTAGLVVQQTWASTGIVVAVGLPAQVEAVLALPGVTYVEGDQELTYQLSSAHDATRSTQALATYTTIDGSRVDGAGVSVAVIDSGIDGSHPFFQQDGVSKVVANLENVCTALTLPTDVCFQQTEPVTNDTDTNSGGGHGTHVAGIVAGVQTTTTSPRVEELRGAAPGAKLVGLSVGAALSIINANAAMQWVVDHQAQPCKPATDQGGAPDPACPPIRVTNHSYGPAASQGGNRFDPNSATVRIQQMLVAKGVVPVWAAGNDGGDGSSAFTNPPAMDPTPGVLMVASYNDGGTGNRDNQLSSFSSRGDKAIVGSFPDLSAPGDLITSSCRPGLPICATGLDPVNGPGPADIGTFNTISGTSMATPYVAGVVAQMFQVNPDLTPGEVEDLLEDNAHKFGSPDSYVADDAARNDDDTTSFDKGHGLVDVAATLAEQLGRGEPGAPAPACTISSVQMVDPAGDATEVVLLDTPLPTQPSLDLREGFLRRDAATGALTAHLRVTDLSAGPPAGAAGEFFRFYFTRGADAEVFLTANRGAAATAFSLRQQSGVSQPVTGVFDVDADEVRITFTPADYAAVLAAATPLVVGDRITVGQVLGQRDGNGATLTADTAAGSCPFVIGESEPVPSGEVVVEPTGSPSPSASASPSPSADPSPSAEPTGTPTGEPTGEPSPSCSPNGQGQCKDKGGKGGKG